MASNDIVRYVLGDVINPNKVLEVVGLQPDQWGPIIQAYPEIAAAGPTAAFRASGQVTILPPRLVSARSMRTIRNISAGAHGTKVHEYLTEGRLAGVLIYMTRGYPHLLIYRRSR